MQTVTTDILSATVYETEGSYDFIVLELPVPMPIEAEGNLKTILVATEGTGVSYLEEHFGIEAEVRDTDEDGFDPADILSPYGLDSISEGWYLTLISPSGVQA